MQLKAFDRIELASRYGRNESLRLGLVLLSAFLVMLMVSASAGPISPYPLLLASALTAGYLALHLGASDFAANLGHVAGSPVLTLPAALALALIAGAAGVLVAGGEVARTVSQDIIRPGLDLYRDGPVWLMLAALLATGLWLGLASILGTPASASHAIVGGVVGAGIAAAGTGGVNWPTLARIAAGWLAAPLLGAMAAAGLHYLLRPVTPAATRRLVPILVAGIVWAFGSYLAFKGQGRLWALGDILALLVGLVPALPAYLLVKSQLARHAGALAATTQDPHRLFALPVICATALLGFAHGANDVATIVGPLAAVADTVQLSAHPNRAVIPLWVLGVGAIGIALGLILYGPRLIRALGDGLSGLDRLGAFSIALAAALSVIIAAELGLPVSTAHALLGAALGVGLLGERLRPAYARIIKGVKSGHKQKHRRRAEAFVQEFRAATVGGKGMLLRQLGSRRPQIRLRKKARRLLRQVHESERTRLGAWARLAAGPIVGVPASGLLAALLFFLLRGSMLP